MGQMLRLTDSTEQIINELTKFIPYDTMSKRIDYLVRDYLRLKKQEESKKHNPKK